MQRRVIVLEHLQWCSVCDTAQQDWMKKNQNLPVWLRKIVQLDTFKWLVKGASPLEKSVINMIELLLRISHWPIMMIGLGCLLLVVPHLFAVPVLRKK